MMIKDSEKDFKDTEKALTLDTKGEICRYCEGISSSWMCIETSEPESLKAFVCADCLLKAFDKVMLK
jgi:hypothetical protein